MAQINFIGIGAQKTASTWLHGVLAQFPQVATSEPKELDFFSAFYDRGYEWYERHIPDATAATWRGEVSPSYFFNSDVPGRARQYNPQMRVLVTLRDPVDRAFSNHLHEVRAGHATGPNRTFETALDNNPLYREQGLYAAHLARWFETFPADQIFVAFQEDIRNDAPAQTARLAEFLGLQAPETVVQRRANESIDYKNRAIGMVFWRLGRFARANGLGGVVERIKQAPVVRDLRAANQQHMRDAVPPMSDAAREELTEFFREDVAQLEALIGRPAPWSRFAAETESEKSAA